MSSNATKNMGLAAARDDSNVNTALLGVLRAVRGGRLCALPAPETNESDQGAVRGRDVRVGRDRARAGSASNEVLVGESDRGPAKEISDEFENGAVHKA